MLRDILDEIQHLQYLAEVIFGREFRRTLDDSVEIAMSADAVMFRENVKKDFFVHYLYQIDLTQSWE